MLLISRFWRTRLLLFELGIAILGCLLEKETGSWQVLSANGTCAPPKLRKKKGRSLWEFVWIFWECVRVG